MQITKDILSQYCDLKEEIKDLRRRKEKKEEEIQKIESDGSVVDMVKGGSGGIEHFKIEGFPLPEYSRKKTSLYMYKAQIENAESELLALTNNIEEYIQNLKDSRIRRILRLRYIDNLTWLQVARSMGGTATADSVRMEHNRFLEI